MKLRLSNIKNSDQDNMKVKDLVEILGNFKHKDYTEQSVIIRERLRLGSVYFGRFDGYLNDTLKNIDFDNSWESLHIFIEKEEEQDA